MAAEVYDDLGDLVHTAHLPVVGRRVRIRDLESNLGVEVDTINETSSEYSAGGWTTCNLDVSEPLQITLFPLEGLD